MNLLFRMICGFDRWLDGFYARGLLLPPTCGEPEAEEIRDALRAGDWPRAEEMLADKPKDWPRRFFLLEAAADWQTEPVWLDGWLAERPNSPHARLVAGAVWMYLAWVARGAGFAETVSAKGAQLFFERLALARETLLRAAEAAPGDPTPWAVLIRVGRGLGLDRDEIGECFAKASAADPGHYHAHYEILQYKCAKWYGSHQEMWTFAREVVSAAPAGSPLCALVATAHAEHASALACEDNVTDPDKVESDYWKRSPVAGEIAKAFQKMHAAAGPLSPDRLAAYSEFAHALWRCGQYKLGAEAFAKLGDRLIAMPWRTELKAAKRFRQARRQCGQA